MLVGDVRVATLQTKQELESNLDSLDRRLRNLKTNWIGHVGEFSEKSTAKSERFDPIRLGNSID